MGCIFFFWCLNTYDHSSTRLGILDDLGLRLSNDDGSYTYPFEEYKALAETAEKAVKEKADVYGRGSNVLAWVPAYDNYDGTERFWRHYELSQLTDDEKQKLLADGFLGGEEVGVEDWTYVWSIMIYYSVLVIGGNEMQPAQVSELSFVVGMNVAGLIFITWISGEIAVLIA